MDSVISNYDLLSILSNFPLVHLLMLQRLEIQTLYFQDPLGFISANQMYVYKTNSEVN